MNDLLIPQLVLRHEDVRGRFSGGGARVMRRGRLRGAGPRCGERAIAVRFRTVEGERGRHIDQRQQTRALLERGYPLGLLSRVDTIEARHNVAIRTIFKQLRRNGVGIDPLKPINVLGIVAALVCNFEESAHGIVRTTHFARTLSFLSD
jgi:hypothetical protein